MTEREKMIKVIKKAFEDCGRMLKEQIPRVLSGEIKKASDGTLPLDEAIADALIAAGIGDTTNLIVENEVLQRDVDNLMRTLEEDTEEFQEVQYRADVEKRALQCLARSFAEAMCKDGNTHHLIDGFIKGAYRQAKKEFAEEKKNDQ